MNFDDQLGSVKNYFENTLSKHGTTAKGVDWNSEQAREFRFDQLARIITQKEEFSILDYGSGYGAFAGYMDSKGLKYSQYIGYDIVPAMVEQGRKLFEKDARLSFTTQLSDVPLVDYATACGVFNMKLDASYGDWNHFVLSCLKEMDDHCRLGFSVNFLTKYSDADKMRPDLYYADPCFLFDYAKTYFSKNVAILHDYGLYDFTLLVRKE